MNMNSARDNKCGREKAPFRAKRTPSIMQKDYIYHAKGPLLHSDCTSFAMQKGFFAHLKCKRIRDASIYTSKKYRSSFYS